MQITDVSPRLSGTLDNKGRSPTGRMLSIACAPDGSAVYAGSYSNLWRSNDDGQSWAQLTWPQPAADVFDVPGSLGGWCVVDIAAGPQAIVLAMTSQDLTKGSRGIWRSTDAGGTWTQVHPFSSSESAGQLEWVSGSDHLVYAACGSSLLVSKDAGANFTDISPWGSGPAKTVNHVAAFQSSPGSAAPDVIYALGDGSMFVNFLDGGLTWYEDKAQLPPDIGGATNLGGNSNSTKVMVVSPALPRQIYITGNGTSDPHAAVLYVLDYSGFPLASQTSGLRKLVLPDYLEQDGKDNANQDSGNVFVAVTQPGCGDLLFYNGQRQTAYVGPLQPTSGSDWASLDSSVHWDLHGILLSPDFVGSIQDGNYKPTAGTVWLLSDGGINRSTDGGRTFLSTIGPNTLAANVAVAPLPGIGPALSLNTGDNDGFYSTDGGQTWFYQQYGGGDDDTAFADPQRPYSMMVLTPRWNNDGDSVHTRDGQTVTIYEASAGSLPNASVQGTSTRHVIPSPPLPSDSVPFIAVWNANSSYTGRGSRPIVLGLPTEQPPVQGDYIFILKPTTAPQLVRSQSILHIANSNEWLSTEIEPVPGANVFLQGPPLPLLADGDSLGVVQASGGHSATVFYVGGNAASELWTWTEGMPTWTRIVPAPAIPSASVGASHAVRFFVSPYLSNLIYILDSNDVKRSDDGGKTWVVDSNLEAQLTWDHTIAISSDDNSSGIGDYLDLILTDMKFDSNNPLMRFAAGKGGAFGTVDGVAWTQLLHSGALAGRPSNCYYDPITDPSDPALYVALAGRSLLKITQLPIAAPLLTVTPSALTFPTQQVGTQSLQQTVTVFADAQVTLTGISFVDDTPGASADFNSVPRPGVGSLTLQNGQLVITVWFLPTAGGTRNATLQIVHNAAGSPLIVELSGVGNAAPLPLLEYSPGSLLLTTTKITNHTVTLTNIGTAPLTINSIAIDGTASFSFGSTCNVGPSGGILNPGQQCTVTVSYHGVIDGFANLVITHNAVGSPAVISIEADVGNRPPP
jgi:hypothetical protein